MLCGRRRGLHQSLKAPVLTAKAGLTASPTRYTRPAEAEWGLLRDGRVLVYDRRSGSLKSQFNYPTGGPRRIAPLQFISGDDDRSLLIGT